MLSEISLKLLGFSKTFTRRFFENVTKGDRDEYCWDWKTCKNSDGYGLIWCGKDWGQIGAHRASWVLHFGEIPEGQKVLHHCDNPKCSNPRHLFLGDDAKNWVDMIGKKRQKFLAKAKITPEDAREIRSLNSEFRKSMAKKYKIDISQISRIINRKRWSHNYSH